MYSPVVNSDDTGTFPVQILAVVVEGLHPELVDNLDTHFQCMLTIISLRLRYQHLLLSLYGIARGAQMIQNICSSYNMWSKSHP